MFDDEKYGGYMKNKKSLLKKTLLGIFAVANLVAFGGCQEKCADPEPIVTPVTPSTPVGNEGYNTWKNVNTTIANRLNQRFIGYEDIEIKALKVEPINDNSQHYQSNLNLVCTFKECGVSKIGTFDISLYDVPSTLEEVVASINNIEGSLKVQGNYCNYTWTSKTEDFAKQVLQMTTDDIEKFDNPQIAFCGGMPTQNLSKFGSTAQNAGIQTVYMFEQDGNIGLATVLCKLEKDKDSTNLEQYLSENPQKTIFDYYLQKLNNSETVSVLHSVVYFDQDISKEYNQLSKKYGQYLPQILDEKNLEKEIETVLKGYVGNNLSLDKNAFGTVEILQSYLYNGVDLKDTPFIMNYRYCDGEQMRYGEAVFLFEYTPKNLKELRDVLYYNANLGRDMRSDIVYENTCPEMIDFGNELLNSQQGKAYLEQINSRDNLKVTITPTFALENNRTTINYVVEDIENQKYYAISANVNFNLPDDVEIENPYQYLLDNPDSYNVSFNVPFEVDMYQRYSNDYEQQQELENYSLADGRYTIYME